MITNNEEKSLVRYNHITYLLYAISFFTAGILWLVPIVMNYLRRRDAENTWLATHFDWQIKTFWYSIIFGIVGIVVFIIGAGGLGIGASVASKNMSIGSFITMTVGGLIGLGAIIWHIYRIVKGWIALSDGQPVQ